MPVLLLLAACAEPDPHRREIVPTDGHPATGSSGATADTGPAEPVDPRDDCAGPPPDGPFEIEVHDITTTEDFDFDGLGGLVWVAGTRELMVADGYGASSVIAPGVSLDTRGIQILSTGDVVAALIREDRLVHVTRGNGAVETWLSGVRGPNGLEVGAGDVVYVTETDATGPGVRVVRYDPTTGEAAAIASGFEYPNGLALNEEQDRLYVSDFHTGIHVLAQDATGAWGAPTPVFSAADDDGYDGVEVDACGRVYIMQYRSGKIVRYDPATDLATLVVDLDDFERPILPFSTLRWGSDRGGWRRDVLYATNRAHVFGVHVGVRGRSQPVDALP